MLQLSKPRKLRLAIHLHAIGSQHGSGSSDHSDDSLLPQETTLEVERRAYGVFLKATLPTISSVSHLACSIDRSWMLM